MKKLLYIVALLAGGVMAHAQGQYWTYTDSAGTAYQFSMNVSATETSTPGVPGVPQTAIYQTQSQFYFTASWSWLNFDPWGSNTLTFSGTFNGSCISTGYAVPKKNILLRWKSPSCEELPYLNGNSGQPWLSTEGGYYQAYCNNGAEPAQFSAGLYQTSSHINAASQWITTFKSDPEVFDSGQGGMAGGAIYDAEVLLMFQSGGYGIPGGAQVPTVTLTP